MKQDPIRPERISDLLDAVYPSFALLAGMELDLFTALANEPLSLGGLADALHVRSEKLRPLLFALVVSGMLIEDYGIFSNSPEAQEFLVRGRPDYLGDMQGLTSNNWKRMLDMAAVIRNGGPLAGYDYHSGDEDLETILRGLYPGTVRDARQLMELVDFSEFGTLLDVGGGSGGLAITLAQSNPHLQAKVLELPSVTPVTRQFIAQAGLESRISVEAADAVAEKVSGRYDLVLARHLFQVLSERENRALLANIYDAVRPGGLFAIIGWVLDDARRSPEKTVGYNLILLNAYQDGQAYTELEYSTWLADAGFSAFRRTVLPGGDSMIWVRRPEDDQGR